MPIHVSEGHLLYLIHTFKCWSLLGIISWTNRKTMVSRFLGSYPRVHLPIKSLYKITTHTWISEGLLSRVSCCLIKDVRVIKNWPSLFKAPESWKYIVSLSWLDARTWLDATDMFPMTVFLLYHLLFNDPWVHWSLHWSPDSLKLSFNVLCSVLYPRTLVRLVEKCWEFRVKVSFPVRFLTYYFSHTKG